MSIKVRKLANLKGAERFGSCASCGQISLEDSSLMRITFSTLEINDTSIWLCGDCANTLIEMLKGGTE